MILSGQSIRARNIMSPCHERGKKNGLTFGLGPSSYDVRVEFDSKGDMGSVTLFPGDFILVSTIEKFDMPNDVMAVAHDKSTLARKGLAVQNTVIDPGWTGYLTLELTNHGKKPIIIERGESIAQVVFHVLDFPAELPYDGKYQFQERGPVLPRES